MGETGLWVRSDVMPDGTYGVALNIGEDRSWPLDRHQAIRYAVACYARATEVEHDAAVFSLLTSIGVPQEAAAQVLASDLRPDRPEQHDDTLPLEFVGALGRRRGTGEIVPLLNIALDGQPAGELTPADLTDHAGGVLKALAAADLDAALHRTLVGVVGVPDGTARGMVDALAEHWPQQHGPRRAEEKS